MYDFDKVIERHNTNSIKYDLAERKGYPADVLPMWVADMDFRAPDGVIEALHKAVDHGIFGYSDTFGNYYEAVAGWFTRRFGWTPEESWLVKTPGVVYAVATAVKALTEPGDAVIVTTPVYYPFFSCVQNNGRTLITSELKYADGTYRIDFDDFEKKIVENDVKMFILCSPHNPICRVWTVEELRKVGEICCKHGVFVVADEIHCDFTMPGHPHTVFPKAVPEMLDRCMVCTAPSKTFNLAGLQASNIWIPNEDARNRFRAQLSANGCGTGNALGLVACQAAYETGDEWLEECKAYIRGNLDYVRGFVAEKLPQIRLIEPEGTYFAWLDCSGLGLSKEELDELVIRKAHLWLDTGSMFGSSAELFQRVVLACPRSIVVEAMDRLYRAINE